MINKQLFPAIKYNNIIYTTYELNQVECVISEVPIVDVFFSSQSYPLYICGEGSIGKSVAARILEAQLLFEGRPCVLFECKYFNEKM